VGNKSLKDQGEAMSDDKQLQQAVLEALEYEPGVNAAQIGVTARDGVVTLLGHVESYWEKSSAEEAARRVKDVKAVAEEIEVRIPSSVKHGDEEIACSAVTRLKWDSSVPTDAVKVSVEKGWVTLTGEVYWSYQQDAAADDVRGIWGVVGVSNQITIKPKQDMSAVSELGELDYPWFDPAKIDMPAQAGRVTAAEPAEIWYERGGARSDAWAAPGTLSNDNDIV
jgi:osmotically-inducible protein OsmY